MDVINLMDFENVKPTPTISPTDKVEITKSVMENRFNAILPVTNNSSSVFYYIALTICFIIIGIVIYKILFSSTHTNMEILRSKYGKKLRFRFLKFVSYLYCRAIHDQYVGNQLAFGRRDSILFGSLDLYKINRFDVEKFIDYTQEMKFPFAIINYKTKGAICVLIFSPENSNMTLEELKALLAKPNLLGKYIMFDYTYFYSDFPALKNPDVLMLGDMFLNMPQNKIKNYILETLDVLEDGLTCINYNKLVDLVDKIDNNTKKESDEKNE